MEEERDVLHTAQAQKRKFEGARDLLLHLQGSVSCGFGLNDDLWWRKLWKYIDRS